MSDRHQSASPKGEEAVVGLKSDLKTLQQLSSSASAAKKHREDSKDDRAKRELMEAIGRGVSEEKGSDSRKSG